MIFLQCKVAEGLTCTISNSQIVIENIKNESDNAAQINSIISTAFQKGIHSIIFKPGIYKIKSPIYLKTGITISGDGTGLTIIEQTVWGHPAFDVLNVDHVTITNMAIVSHQNRTYPNGFVSRGTDGFVNNAGIYSNSSSGVFQELTISGFTCGLLLSSWNGNGLYEQKLANKISDLKVDLVDFGILATGQKDLVIQNVSGSYKQQTGSGAPPHLIYISDAIDPKFVWSENLTIQNCYAHDGNEGRAYQFGSIIGGKISNLNSIRCAGILAIENFVGVTVDTLIALEDLTHEVGSIFIQPEKVENVKMKNIHIESLNPEARLLLLDGKNCMYSDITLKTQRSQISDANMVVFVGQNSILERIQIINENEDTGAVGVFVQGENLKVNDIYCLHCRAAVNINDYCNNCEVKLDEKKIIPPLKYKDFKLGFNRSANAKFSYDEKY